MISGLSLLDSYVYEYLPNRHQQDLELLSTPSLQTPLEALAASVSTELKGKCAASTPSPGSQADIERHHS